MKNVNSPITTEVLPKGFDYYAGGHIHTFMELEIFNNSKISYSGCLFPNNFFELKTEKPGFNICEFDFSTRKTQIKREYLKIYEKEFIKIEINNLNSIESYNLIIETIDKFEIENKLILLEIYGVVDGKLSDINFSKIISYIYNKGAKIVLKNTYKLNSKLMEDKKINIVENIKEIEDFVIDEYLYNSKFKEKDHNIISKLFKENFSKIEDEKNYDFEERIIKLIEKSFNSN